MRLVRFAIVSAIVVLAGECLASRLAWGQDFVADAVEAVAQTLAAGKPASTDTPTAGLAELFAEPLQIGAAEGKAAPDDPALKRLRPLLFRELNFVRVVCDLPVELRGKVKTAALDSLGQVNKELKNPNWREGIIWINAADNQGSDPSNVIRAKLFEVLKKELPAETFAAIEKEWMHRQSYERSATIAAAIYLIDEKLRLDEKQREAIAKGIAENWEDRFGTWRVLAQYNWEYLPNIPDKIIKPLLNEEQTTLWNATPRHTVGMGLGGDEIGPPDEAWWDGAEGMTGDLLRDLFADRQAPATN